METQTAGMLRTSSVPLVGKLLPEPFEAPKGLCLSDSNDGTLLTNDAFRLQSCCFFKSQIPARNECVY